MLCTVARHMEWLFFQPGLIMLQGWGWYRWVYKPKVITESLTSLMPLISLYILAHHNWLTCTKVCFNKIGSKAGSRVSPTSSRRTGIPMRIQFSRVRRKFWSVSLITLSPFFASFARIHRLALKFECRKEIKVSKSEF